MYTFLVIDFFFISGPQVFSGHTSGIRHVIFFRNDTHLVSCADDKSLRVWDRATGTVSVIFVWIFLIIKELLTNQFVF